MDGSLFIYGLQPPNSTCVLLSNVLYHIFHLSVNKFAAQVRTQLRTPDCFIHFLRIQIPNSSHNYVILMFPSAPPFDQLRINSAPKIPWEDTGIRLIIGSLRLRKVYPELALSLSKGEVEGLRLRMMNKRSPLLMRNVRTRVRT